MSNLIPKHGGYESLKSFQMTVIIYDLTVEFCKKYITSFKMKDQLEGAARSGSQNIGEGSDNSATSKQAEIRLVNVAKGSQKELKLDMEAFLRQNNLPIWNKEDPRALEIRKLCYQENKSYKTYSTYMSNNERAANCLLCLINQATFLLDKQIKSLEKDLVKHGDFKDRYNEVRKQEILDRRDDEKEFLKQFGIKFDQNGLVIYDNKDNLK
jgi:restriction system protein